ncbi:rhombosortase [Ferrimonas lipolytica]|uniref:Rhombosortase n=1 Tax=Ferrimonas lipolytica TaxID=2724191 RepID=A0A6H1UB91_9GAMM|nr:rhombosortase [Ferrimonas lipolytica]QIZ76325.1 rhombosortase [Ferrimonas lipolytica]
MTKGNSWPTWSQLALPLSLCFMALILATMPELKDNLDWSRVDIEQGQYWRLVTGHLLHTNSYHLWMNLGGLWLIFGLHQPYYGDRTIWLVTLAMMLIISTGIYVWVADTWRYVGLSGLLHGLFTWGALLDIKCQWRSGWLLLAGVIAKVSWENVVGANASTTALIDSRIAVESHLLGVIAALVLFLLFQLTNYWRNCRLANR